MTREYDVIIIGGGIVGNSLALALAKVGVTVAIVEFSSAPIRFSSLQTDKTIVLSHSSSVIFTTLGLWEHLAETACPIREIHVSDQGHFGGSRIQAEQEKLSALGYVLPAAAISNCLYSALASYPNIILFQPAKFESFTYENDQVIVTIQQEGKPVELRGRLLVACDGHLSSVRRFLNIPTTTYDYKQVAVICNIGLKRDHNNIAYERFTEQGPLAMLPLGDRRSAIIWTVYKTEATKLLSYPCSQFLTELQRQFGYRSGKIISASPPVAIPLQLITTTQQIKPGVVLLGNSVHTLHPVAGQGLNLALRDLAVLAEVLVAAYKEQQPLGSIKTLQNYSVRREKDQQHTISFTHSLVGLFSNSLLPLVLARNAGMILLDRVNSLKKQLTRRALGLSGKVPRLACGLGLEN